MNKARRDSFLNLCLHLRVPSKEENLVALRPWGTQMHIVERVFEGIGANRRHFTILKAGQTGTTSISLAFILYWLWCNEGVVGAFVADDNDRKNYFNGLVRSYIRSLEGEAGYRIPVEGANFSEIRFSNESVLTFSHANKRQKGKLGRGIGVAVLHCTECAFWEDAFGFSTLLERLSMRNPSSLAIFESTANGHNFFKEKWEVAKRSTEQEAIFVGWWMHGGFKEAKGSRPYDVYWASKPELDLEERRWVEIVKRRYGWEISPEQVAWWRAKVSEVYNGDLGAMYQENPPSDDYAFQFSGKTFIDKKVLNLRLGEVSNIEKAPGKAEAPVRCFRFVYAEDFAQTRMEEVSEKSPYVELKVWEAPCYGKGVVYAIGVDPCHGTNQESADAALQVLRCYADAVEQVAEFRSKALPPYRLARVILYLGAAYGADTMFGIEIQGGGSETFQEMDRIRAKVGLDTGVGLNKEIARHFQRLATYMYSRSDAARKSFASKHFHTTEKIRYEVLEIVRTCVSDLKFLKIHSRELVDQLGMLERTGTGSNRPGEVEPRVGIDLVMSFGFGLKIWDEHLRYKLQGTAYKYGFEEFERERVKSKNQEIGYSMDELIQDRLLNWRRSLAPSK